MRSIVAVGSYGKVKTAAQMVGLTLLMLARPGNEGMTESAAVLQWVGVLLLYVATGLSCVSLAQYCKAAWRYSVQSEGGAEPDAAPILSPVKESAAKKVR